MRCSHHGIKFALEKILLDLAGGGRIPEIVGLHHVTVEGDTVHVAFDLRDSDEPLFFDFERPALVSRAEVREFGEWLASTVFVGTVH